MFYFLMKTKLSMLIRGGIAQMVERICTVEILSKTQGPQFKFLLEYLENLKKRIQVVIV